MRSRPVAPRPVPAGARWLLAACVGLVALAGTNLPCIAICLNDAHAASARADDACCHERHDAPTSPCLHDQAPALTAQAGPTAVRVDLPVLPAVLAPAPRATVDALPAAPRLALAPDRSPPRASGPTILRI